MDVKTKSNFLSYLHSFRGIAIISIVAGHAVSGIYYTAHHKYYLTDPILIINEICFNQCTLYFALLSGLLYSAILKEKSYIKFYKSRLLYVFLPYLFLTILYSIVKFQRYNFIYLDRMDMLFEHVCTNLLFGGANFVLWYMPVLFGLYILTPFFNFLFKHKKQSVFLLWVIIFLPLLSSGIKIPTVYGVVISKVIYFSGAYVLGMYWGVNLEASMNWLTKYVLPISLLAFITTLLLAYQHYAGINRLGGINVLDSVYYIQKMCLAIVIIILLKHLGERQPGWLKKIAVYSTPIYFIHGAIVFSCAPLFLFMIKGTYTSLSILLGAIALLIFTIALSMFIAFLIKKVVGVKSRMVIGA